MVSSVTSLGRSGLHDWFIQRLSAVVMAVFSVCVVWFLVTTPELTHQALLGFFSGTLTKSLTILTLILLSLHIWIGMWIVSTDYIKPVAIRMVFQAALIIYCLVLIFWSVQIFWSV